MCNICNQSFCFGNPCIGRRGWDPSFQMSRYPGPFPNPCPPFRPNPCPPFPPCPIPQNCGPCNQFPQPGCGPCSQTGCLFYIDSDCVVGTPNMPTVGTPPGTKLTTVLTAIDGRFGAVPQTRTVAIPISSAQLLSISTNPIQVAEAPGIGLAHVFTSGVIMVNYKTTAYGSGSTIQLQALTAATTDPQGVSGTILTSTVSATGLIQVVTGKVGGVTVIENQPLVITAASNPTLGDSSIMVYVTYMTIAL